MRVRVRVYACACAYTVTLVWDRSRGRGECPKGISHFLQRQRKRIFVLWRKKIVVAGSAPASPDSVIVYGSFGGMAPAKGFSTRASSQPVARVQTRVQMVRGKRRWALFRFSIFFVLPLFPLSLVSFSTAFFCLGFLPFSLVSIVLFFSKVNMLLLARSFTVGSHFSSHFSWVQFNAVLYNARNGGTAPLR